VCLVDLKVFCFLFFFFYFLFFKSNKKKQVTKLIDNKMGEHPNNKAQMVNTV
jgi:hypothetical protein